MYNKNIFKIFFFIEEKIDIGLWGLKGEGVQEIFIKWVEPEVTKGCPGTEVGYKLTIGNSCVLNHMKFGDWCVPM